MCRRRPLLRAGLVAAALSTSLPVVLSSAVPSAGARPPAVQLGPSTDTTTTVYGPHTNDWRGRAALMSPTATDPFGRRFK